MVVQLIDALKHQSADCPYSESRLNCDDNFPVKDIYKMMVPSQIISERGSDIIVINPGSANLRLGLASSQSPLVIPHVIAWQVKRETSGSESVGANVRVAVGEDKYKSLFTAAKQSEREECLQQIESQLNIRPSKEEGRSLQKKLDALESLNSDATDEYFTWAEVKLDGVVDGGEGCQTIHKFICGEDALKIPARKPYMLRRPICRGRFNASEQYSFQQVCDDICIIWDWVLSTKLGLNTKQRQQFSAVLVVPDTFDSRETKELLTIILRDLHFGCAVLHQESVSVTFGTGVSSGCVVNIGAQVTVIICVEDGVALPITRIVLPFGGDDISRCLLWLQRLLKTWPAMDCDPLTNPVDLLLLNKVKEKNCRIQEGDCRACVELQFHCYGTESQKYRVVLSELNVPPMGLFFPAVLAPDEYVPLTRPWYHTDSEEIMLDDALHMDTIRRSDMYDTGLPFGTHSSVFEYPEHSIYASIRQSRVKNEDKMMGLAEAIVKSILSSGRMDLQKKLFSSIQLAGGSASIPGLIDTLEERVLHTIPMHESIDTVEVLPPRMETSTVAWKGGAVLGILDFARDTWLQRDEWIGGGVQIGSGRKYKDSFFLQTHAFWYTSS